MSDEYTEYGKFYTLEGDKKGFGVPATPGDSLRMLNNYMRTDLLRPIHLHIEQMKEKQEKGSPLEHLTKSIALVLERFESAKLFELVRKNPFHFEPIYDFNPEKDYLHDIKLMRHHLECHQKTLAEINDRYL